MKELWKDIKNYENYFQISNLGRIRGLDRYIKYERKGRICERFQLGKILVLGMGKDDYNIITLNKDGTKITYDVHRLVAQHFILNLKNNPVVHHIDHNKKNNKTDNLKWVTYSENELFDYKDGFKVAKKGKDSLLSKLTEDEIRIIRRSNTLTLDELSKLFNTTFQNISCIVNYKTWKINVPIIIRKRLNEKLTKIEVKLIKRSDTLTQIERAKIFNVSPAQINRIISNKLWRIVNE